MKFKNLKFLGFAILVFGLAACGGDSSTGPDPEEAPELPEIQSEQAQPDLSFFEDNEPKMLAKGDTANYYEARYWALWQGGLNFAFANSYSGFLMSGSNEDAVYDDGVWVWEYSFQSEEGSYSMRLTSEEVADGYRWAMYWSFDDGETSVEDYLVMEGTVSKDGSEGNWTFNTLNPDTNEEQVAYTSEWTVTSETESDMIVKWYDDSGTVSFSASYEKNEPDHTMTYTSTDESDIILYWNSDTNEGYFEEDGVRSCWDENFKDVACS